MSDERGINVNKGFGCTSGNNNWWIWILVIAVIILIFCPGIFNGRRTSCR